MANDCCRGVANGIVLACLGLSLVAAAEAGATRSPLTKIRSFEPVTVKRPGGGIVGGTVAFSPDGKALANVPPQ